MFVNSCPFCKQVNPVDAKFCNACGGVLHLAPCPRCGAVSDVTATICYQCNSPLPGRKTEEADSAPPAIEARRRSPRRQPAAMIAGAAFAAILVLGYYGYRQSLPANVPRPAAASTEASARSGPAGTSAAAGNVAAGDTTPATSDERALPASLGTSAAPGTSLSGRKPAAGKEGRTERETEEPRQANSASGLIARSKAADAGKSRKRQPPRQEVCTNAVAALGLCTMTPEERRLVEATAALKAAIAEPAAREPGKAGKQGPAQGEPCTEALAALALCSPASTQREE
jgi:Double zinc ribbon